MPLYLDEILMHYFHSVLYYFSALSSPPKSLLLGELPLLPAEMIDHEVPFTEEITPSVTLEYGKYLAVSCQGCHGENMKGGKPIAPGFPPVADITSTGNRGKWTHEQFMTTLRTGRKTPESGIYALEVSCCFYRSGIQSIASLPEESVTGVLYQ